MLTSFFGKSKPINFIMVSVFIIIGGLFNKTLDIEQFTTLSFFKTHIVLLLFILFSVFLLNFIIRKNKLTETNTYTILCFGCFILLFPELFFRSDIIISNILILLAFRRIMSLNSGINMEKKILDASIWITIASLFYFWCILYFLVLFVGVFQLRLKNYKLILIPFVGHLSVIIILIAVKLVFNNSFLWFLEMDTGLSLDFQKYDSLPLIIPISFLILMIALSLIHKLFNFSEIRLIDKSNSFLLILILFTSAIVIIFFPNKNGAEFLYIMAPLAIISTNFIEKSTLLWVKELFLWIVVALPIVVLFL